jgi:modulator of FtsH protease HflK
MPWNEPGKNNDPQDPWGGGKKDKGPPDLDKIITDLGKKISQFFSGKKTISWPPNVPNGMSFRHYGAGITLLAVAALMVWFVSGLFIANPAEQAVILRFGKYLEVLPPGLHWIARFVDTKYLVDIQKIHSFSLQGDFLTKSTEQSDLPNQYITLPKKTTVTPVTEGADKSKNLVSVELSVQYTVRDPRAYLFSVVNPDQTIEQVASSALSDVVGQMKLDEVLTIGRESLSSGVAERIKQVLKNYSTGLQVVAVTLRKVQAPDQVRVAFNDVNRADQDRSTYIQHAQAYASRVVPLAQGNAARIQADANGYRQQVVLNAQANIAKYQALMRVYQNSPDITRERMYLETIEKILSNTSKILVDVNGSNNVMYLPLDQLLNSTKNLTKLNVPNAPVVAASSDPQNGTGVPHDNH